MKKLNDNMMVAVVAAGKVETGIGYVLARRYKMLRLLGMLFGRSTKVVDLRGIF